MMNGDAHQKVTAQHLKRNAYLYVRQSTLRQVFENTESTERQYALKQRAVALGWPQDQVIVIDDDQGQSGATMAGRDGFQRLVADVGMGRAGIVMGLEVSRLARNSSDWHRLLEICALSGTLILDEDGVYDPGHFNDRLLLGLKGTMSEAELHVLRARLRGGLINKARRGELESKLPIGLIYDGNGRVILDPDKQVQESIRALFQNFRRTGSAFATVRAFHKQGLKFPRHPRTGPARGEVVWGDLVHSRVLWILHNPRYAGAFFFGRSRHRSIGGRMVSSEALPRDQWTSFIQDAHAGYIGWDEFEENQRTLRANSQAHGLDRRKSPPREGPALLQGLAMCGICGGRMTVRYYRRAGKLVPNYVCQKEGIESGAPICQSISGGQIDEAIGRLLVAAVTPMALEATLSVEQELKSRAEETDNLRSRQVERARYEAELARRRYMQVDPDNRLVADELEAEWNRRLRLQTEAQQEYEQQREHDRAVLDSEQRARILALATDLPRLWCNPSIPDRERKRIARLLIEDVTLTKGKQITAAVRFRGGDTSSLILPPALNAWQMRQTSPKVVAEVDKLLSDHIDSEIAVILNSHGFHSGQGKPFDGRMIANLRRAYGLKSRHERLRAAGMLTIDEIALRLGVHRCTVMHWRAHGLLRAHMYSDKHECLYENPGDQAPTKLQGRKLEQRRRFPDPCEQYKGGAV